MNRKYLLALTLIPAILTILLYDSSSVSNNLSVQTSPINSGHVTVTVRDSGGAVTGYGQSDNIIINSGENCWAKMLFRHPTNAGTTVCTGATNAAWNYLCLGENAALGFTQTDLTDPADSAGLATCQQGTITWTQNSTGTTSALSKVVLRVSSTFTNGGAAETINQVGLANESSINTRSMLAIANFTDQSVAGAGTITINYDFEWGGGTVP